MIGKARDEKPHAPVQKVDEKSEKPEKFSKPKGKENAKNPLAHSGGGLCFLFEVTENKARSVLVKEKNGTVEVLNVEIFPDESYRNFQREMVWSEFSQWVKKVTTEKSQGQRFDTKVLLTGHGVYVDVVDRPDVSVKEMKDNIAFQVAENIPFTLDDSLLRYELTEDTALAATVDPEFREKVLSGFHEDLVPELAKHMDVDGIWYFGNAGLSSKTEELSVGNLKRTWVAYGKSRDWFENSLGQGDEFLRQASHIKNIWIPYGA